MLPKKLAFVDIETTGLGVTRDRIIEIGILRVEDNKLVDTFHSLINPEGFASPFSLELTGIKPQELESSPTFYEIMEDVSRILQDCVFVAHNVRFDYGFIRNEFRRYQMKFTSKHFCTVKLSQTLFPQERKHNLDAIIGRFNITCRKRHRAFDDAKVLWDFYQQVQKDFSPNMLEEAIARTAKKTAVPIAISTNIIDNLPERPGVYIFYGESQTPLYVGKSVNIKERVLSHFSSDHESTREMNIAQQIQHIETIPTSGELGALIKESQLIKSLQPIYNRQLRVARKLHILKKEMDGFGYPIITLSVVDEISPHEIASIVGIFRSKRQAKSFLIPLVKKHQLCEKLLGLEKTSSSCFAYRLGICKGACVQEEKTLTYQMRFSEAFANYTIKPWPFSGSIVISEEDTLKKTGEYFIVDKWCLLSQYEAVDDVTKQSRDKGYTFDLDTYKLLVRFLEKRKNWKRVKILKHNSLKSNNLNQHLISTLGVD